MGVFEHYSAVQLTDFPKAGALKYPCARDVYSDTIIN